MANLQIGEYVMLVGVPEEYKEAVGQIIKVEEGYLATHNFMVPTTYDVLINGTIFTELTDSALRPVTPITKWEPKSD
jgi:hypothetical protein